jgi:cellobiose phosphorylase
MYRLIVESLLGLQLDGERLRVAPWLPDHWGALKIHYRYRETVYHIDITQAPRGDGGDGEKARVMVDGVEQDGLSIALVDDHREHRVEIRLTPA